MDWSDLLAAFALYLVLEGITPFSHPQALKRVMQEFIKLPDRQLRVAGLVSMLVGVALLYFIRAR